MKNKTQREKLYDKILKHFIEVHNQQLTKTTFKDTKELFLFLHNEYKSLVIDAKLIGPRKKWDSGFYFIYIVAESLYDSNVFPNKKDYHLPKKVWNIITKGLTETNIFENPDQEKRNIIKLINEKQYKQFQKL